LYLSTEFLMNQATILQLIIFLFIPYSLAIQAKSDKSFIHDHHFK